MNHSDTIANLADALSKAQAELKSAAFDKKNPFLNNRPYASLGSHIDASKPVLAKFGLSVSQLVTSDGGRLGIETVLMHKSGEWLSSVVMIEPQDEKGKSFAQVAGSIISYFRRYALAAILNMYSDEDNDGATESTGTQAGTQQQKAVGTSGSATRAPATTSAPALEAKPDDNEPAAADWTGVKMYQDLFAEAFKLKVKAESITPGKTTRGQVRALYAALETSVTQAKAASVTA